MIFSFLNLGLNFILTPSISILGLAFILGLAGLRARTLGLAGLRARYLQTGINKTSTFLVPSFGSYSFRKSRQQSEVFE